MTYRPPAAVLLLDDNPRKNHGTRRDAISQKQGKKKPLEWERHKGNYVEKSGNTKTSLLQSEVTFFCVDGAIISKQTPAGKSSLAMLVIDFPVTERFAMKR
ncbi:hypothetical protein ACIPO9_01335 [Pseudomonas sp. NPDC090203]|jgi:hypothetical protein|uniref:hypothetical protein n=1 Tax=Pseudomonas TaxID=286 RepID=UPI002363B628|nr:hypothetical protein [Pseudomonas putida]MDD1969299.1 hypothetical protein [Pseudomonas putida]